MGRKGDLQIGRSSGGRGRPAVAALLGALALALLGGCGSDDGAGKTGSAGPSEGFSSQKTSAGKPALRPPKGSVAEGYFVNGERSFYLYKNTRDGRIYAGALYVRAHLDASIPCIDPDITLQPHYGPDGATSGYVQPDNTFTVDGVWTSLHKPNGTGTASGRISEDGSKATISWGKSLCIDDEHTGDRVVFTRVR